MDNLRFYEYCEEPLHCRYFDFINFWLNFAKVLDVSAFFLYNMPRMFTYTRQNMLTIYLYWLDKEVFCNEDDISA